MLSFFLFVGTFWYAWYYISKLLQTKGKNKLISHSCGGLFGLVMASMSLFTYGPEKVESENPKILPTVPRTTVYTPTSAQSLIQENPTQAYLSNSLVTPLPKAESTEDEAHITIRSSYSPQHLEQINKEQSVSRLVAHSSGKTKELSKSPKNTHVIENQNQSMKKVVRNEQPSLKSLKKSQNEELSFQCSNSKRRCEQMDNCAKAKYHLRHCGVKSLDRDRDRVPCESLCG
ncbi:excalibur calcium-binding domain-containing protein [Actinobacillus capsulatus]|uniref:excalibur calcium-binding domain-containing protein n=1 Tax=Actinobacillus capsulatus TaxID=717 RepID=UPI000369F73C|nr:excalibur calcium-binding domain-containing protein [Actinobacillus capsulatus]